VQYAFKLGVSLSFAAILVMGRAWGEPPKKAPDKTKAVGAKSSQLQDTHASFVKLSLLSRGDKPRRVLAYKWRRGQKEEFTVTMNVSTSTSAGGRTGKWVSGPTTKLEGRLTVDEVEVDGTAAVSYEYDVTARPGGPDEPSKENTNTALVKGLKGRYLLSPQGSLKDVTLNLPSELDPSLAQMIRSAVESLRNFFIIFPLERVGVGSSWEITWPKLQLLDLISNVRYRYRIESLEAQSVVLAVNGYQHVDEQKMQNPPGLPPGSEIKLVSSDSLLQGQFVHDLTRLTPQAYVTGVGKTVTLMTIKEDGGTKEREITTTMKMEMNIRRKE